MILPPILMYHIVDNENEAKIAVTEAQFQSHLKLIHEKGYCTLTIAEYLEIITGVRPFDRQSVLITFDDGYDDVYTRAAPELLKYNFHASVYLLTGYMGNLNWWNRKASYMKQHITWQQARELLDMGWDLGAHTVEHYSLVKLPPEMIEREMVASKQAIEEHTSATVHSFCYPYGDINPLVEEIASRYFEVAFAVDQGTFCQPDRWRMNRLSMNRSWTVEKLSAVLGRMLGDETFDAKKERLI